LRAGRAVCGSWVTFADLEVARSFGRSGFAFLAVDMEHG
jgi:2-keto-3-deoxy-L-rhamnonate aldolase RhmA